MIRRSLGHDFRYFTLTAVVLFGLMMAALFLSIRLFVGMLCTCASAVLLTLLIQSMLGHKIGILTVNLGTIVFVIAMSHLVYMTFNWQTLADRSHRMGKESPDLAMDALRMTFPPSFWYGAAEICACVQKFCNQRPEGSRIHAPDDRGETDEVSGRCGERSSCRLPKVWI